MFNFKSKETLEIVSQIGGNEYVRTTSMISIIFVFDKQAIESTLKVQPIIWYEESNLETKAALNLIMIKRVNECLVSNGKCVNQTGKNTHRKTE